jgi:hypothetical protein
MKKKQKRKYLEEKWNYITGTKAINVLKSKLLWGNVIDAVAILGIATILLLTVVFTVPLMLIYMAVVGAIILWEERNGL